MTEKHQRAKAIFMELVGKVPSSEWDRRLDEACAGDAELRARVSALLRAHLAPGSFLDHPAVATADQPPALQEPIAERPGTQIGPYELLQVIGEGGMGLVYMAEQTEPVRRRVALKIIRPGMDTRQVFARFEAERQALSLMDHPNIARVLDAGTTVTGRPYFVMELVQGIPITQYCDEHRLTPRERLELFVPVCHAVQHAHQKGIIHRDIKPSNVMMAEYDGRPVPKVIDFGVAKAIEQPLNERTMFTQLGQVVGTIDYMSPEQAKLNQLDIDTRSDIYSLGVLLYELLTGDTPLDRQRLRSAVFDEMLRIIREEEPPRPSLRLRSSPSLPAIAARRHVDPKKLSTLVRGELDWIVMKALDKDRTRRYPTATGLAYDVERYLRDEPVRACPPSAVYRIRKFARRNKGPVLAAGLILLALVAGICGTTVELIRAERAERENQDRLWRSCLDQARAARFTRQAGQRFKSMKTLAEAARIVRKLELGDEEILKLRNEAIACLALADLRFERQLLGELPYRRYHRYSISFDSKFQHFALTGPESDVELYRVADQQQIGRLPCPVADPTWVVPRFSPNGHWLFIRYDISGQPSQARLAEFRDGKLLPKGPLDQARIPLDFSPDSSLLAAKGADDCLRFYQVASGREVKRLSLGAPIWEGRFRPDGRQLAISTGRGRSVLLVDVQTGEERARFPHDTETEELSWRGDGRLLAVGCSDQRIHVWDAVQQKPQSVLEGHHGRGIRVQFSHRGDFLVSMSWDGSTRLWDAVTGQELVSTVGHFVDISPDDRRLALWSEDHLELWEVAGGRECRTLHHSLVGNRTLRPDDWGPRSADFSPDSRFLASVSLDGVRLWDLADPTADILHLPVGFGQSVLFHPDGGSLLAYTDTGLRRWPIPPNAKSNNPPGPLREFRLGPPELLELPVNSLSQICCDSSGRWLAAVDPPRQALVLDLEHPTKRTVLGSHENINNVSLSIDGKWAATATWHGSNVKVWDVTSGKLVKEFPGHSGRTIFSPDGRWLVTSMEEMVLRFWHVGTWQPGPVVSSKKRVLEIPSTMGFAPDSSMIVVGDAPAPRLVRPDTGQELATLEAAEHNACTFVRVSPDGRWLAAGTADHTIHLWDLQAVRRQLADIGLDWNPPAGSPARPTPIQDTLPPAAR